MKSLFARLVGHFHYPKILDTSELQTFRFNRCFMADRLNTLLNTESYTARRRATRNGYVYDIQQVLGDKTREGAPVTIDILKGANWHDMVREMQRAENKLRNAHDRTVCAGNNRCGFISGRNYLYGDGTIPRPAFYAPQDPSLFRTPVFTLTVKS